MVRENMSCDITLDHCGCVHGDASFHHDIIPECPWPSETDVRIASKLYNSSLQLAVDTDPTLHCGQTQIIEGCCDGGSVHCLYGV